MEFLKELDELMELIIERLNLWIKWDKSYKAYLLEDDFYEQLYPHIHYFLLRISQNLLESQVSMLMDRMRSWYAVISNIFTEYYEVCSKREIESVEDYTIIDPEDVKFENTIRYFNRRKVRGGMVCFNGKILILPVDEEYHELIEDLIEKMVVHEELHKVVEKLEGLHASLWLDFEKVRDAIEGIKA